MLENLNNNEALQYQKLSQEECESRGILGRLVGKIADWKRATRNGRKYTADLWEKVFESPIMKEKIENRCCFGELGHPEDRTEIDMEKIAVCLAEPPKKSKDGFLYGVFDILPTPNGKILKSLCDYGCNVGVSSRGSGDTYTDEDGNEQVDPDTYECECFDIVLIPAVKEARLQYVKESLETSKKSLNESLKELVDSASLNDKKIMTETLDQLKINYSSNDGGVVDYIQAENESSVATDGWTVVRELQESLKKNKSLEDKVASLQEQLSVSHTKGYKQEEMIENYKSSIEKLSKSSKQVVSLQTQIKQLQEKLQKRDNDIASYKSMISSLKEQNESMHASATRLTEQAEQKHSNEVALKKQITLLEQSVKRQESQSDSRCKLLEENIQELKKDSAIANEQYKKKVAEAQSLAEKYKKIAKSAVDKYIESQARMVGVSTSDIKGRLDENYSFKDIDRVCEDLQQYKVNISKLPFNLATSKVKLKESKEAILPTDVNQDDELDEQLKRLANL